MAERLARPSVVHQKLRPKRSRVKTGCIPCRLRKKRCDEQKPVCSGCERNHLICAQTSNFQGKDTLSNEDAGIGLQSARLPPVSKRGGLVTRPPSMAIVSQNAETLGQGISMLRYPEEALGYDRTTGLGRICRFSSPEMFSTASLREPASRILLEYYFNETAHRLSLVQGPGSPYLICVLPLAQSDSMVMDSVLALSGAHLCCMTDGSDTRSASSMHYALALRQLKHELTRVASGEPSDPVRLLLTILLLGYTEFISGDAHGAIFHHLRASSHFVSSIIALDLNHVDQEVHAFLLETFAYLASIINITVNTQPTHPAVILDPYDDVLERFESCKASGSMFGYARRLFTLIPSICKLGYNRLFEEASGDPSFESIALYKSLQSRVESWQLPDTAAQSGTVSTDLAIAAQIYQQAILIFLHAAFYASEVNHPQLLTLLDSSIDKMIPLVGSVSSNSSVWTTLLWPGMIFGSCLRDPVYREFVRERMLKTPYNMAGVVRAVQLLELLWEDSAPESYGPYGLGNIMKKYGRVYSMG